MTSTTRLLDYTGNLPPKVEQQHQTTSLAISNQHAWVLHVLNDQISGIDNINFRIKAQVIRASGACGDSSNPSIAYWPALQQGQDVFVAKLPFRMNSAPSEQAFQFSAQGSLDDSYMFWAGKGKKTYSKKPRFGLSAPPTQAAIIVGLGSTAQECKRTYNLTLMSDPAQSIYDFAIYLLAICMWVAAVAIRLSRSDSIPS